LPVDLGRLQGVDAQLPGSIPDPEQQPGHSVPAEDGSRECRGLATSIAVRDDVRGEQADKSFGIALRCRGEEPPRELLLPQP
jgi:hypothetical protein